MSRLWSRAHSLSPLEIVNSLLVYVFVLLWFSIKSALPPWKRKHLHQEEESSKFSLQVRHSTHSIPSFLQHSLYTSLFKSVNMRTALLLSVLAGFAIASPVPQDIDVDEVQVGARYSKVLLLVSNV